MPTVSLAPQIKRQFFDSNGDPLAGGLVYTYQSGTTTPQATYTDNTGGTPNANPVVLDAGGEASIWLDVSLSYKFVVKTSAGVTLRTEDGIIGLLTNNAVPTAALQDLSVTTPKLAEMAVTGPKLSSSASVDATRAVGTDHVKDANITRPKLATGAIAASVTASKTAAYTAVAATDDTIRCDTQTTGAFTVTLPDAATCSGKKFHIVKIDSGTNLLTIDGNGSQTIAGATDIVLSGQYESVIIESDGSNWQILSSNITTYKESSQGAALADWTASQYADVTSVSLSKGRWEIYGHLNMDTTGAITESGFQVGVGTATGNSSSGLGTVGSCQFAFSTTGRSYTASVGKDIRTPTATTTYYLKGIKYGANSSAMNYSGRITARKIGFV
jgi:hypothetical protein